MTSNDIDATRLTLALNELRLPAIKALWPSFAEQADKEGWRAARLLSALVEHELAERDRRRVERHIVQARLLPGKTLDTFDFTAVPALGETVPRTVSGPLGLSKAHVNAITAPSRRMRAFACRAMGDSWVGKGANILLFGPPGVGKSHLSSAIGLALIENGYRVLFTRTTDLVQKLQEARRDLALESAIAKLDKFDLPILDDIAYVTKDQAETSVLFELISARYERRSMLLLGDCSAITCQAMDHRKPTLRCMEYDLPRPGHDAGRRRSRSPVGSDQWRLTGSLHHATIFEMNVESYRRKAAQKVRGSSRPTKTDDTSDNKQPD
jgi:DNA replication protein DnaC